jgi:hypothetical protein
MKACLIKIELEIWFYKNGVKIKGKHEKISGDVSGLRGNVSWLSGDVSGLSGDVSWLRGNVSGLSGDVWGIRGDVSGLRGNVNEAELSEDERNEGVDVAYLIKS